MTDTQTSDFWDVRQVFVSLATPRLFGQGDQIALQAFDLDGRLLLGVDLMELGADAQEDAAGADRRQATVIETLAQLQDVPDAIRLGQQPSAVKGVHVNLRPAGLVAAKKIPRQT